MLRFTGLILPAALVFALAAPAAAQQPAAAKLTTVATLKYSKGADTELVAKVPPKTRTVSFMVSGGGIYCTRVRLTRLGGATTAWANDSHFVDTFQNAQSISKGDPGEYASFTATCHSDGATGQIVVSAGP
ncbi:MAG: hypothetical protein ABJC74_07760 [Gemmatimonadota bacterium]